jgi:1,4-dihydroxy-2-naphthoate octaprenyltransferase
MPLLSTLLMWGRALRTIPRISRDEWERLDPVSRWLIATRAAVLILTFASAAIGGLLAYRAGRFDGLLFTLCTLGLLLSHATNNLLNDITDFYKGVDQDNYFRAQYGPQPLLSGLLSMRQMIAYTAGTGLCAIALGVALCVVRGAPALQLFLAGAFFVLFYTWPLKYIGLGEVAVILVWGPLMVGGTYFIVTGTWDTQAALAGLPHALGATTVLFGKHIDKLDADRRKGIRTLPVLLGERAARLCTLGLFALQYGSLVALCARGYFSPAPLLALLALPTLRLCVRAYKDPRPAAPPKELPEGVWPLWFSAFAFHHNRRFALLFLLGLAVDAIIRRGG